MAHRDGHIQAPDFASHDAEYRVQASTAFIDVYAPETLDEICGNGDSIGALEECISNGVQQPIVVCGPPGVGKHTAARLLLQKYKFDTVEFAMSLQSIESVQKLSDPEENVMLALMQLQSKRAIVCSDVEALSKPDRGKFLTLLQSLSKHTLCVIVSHVPYEKCICVRFEELAPEDVAVHLCWVAACENIECDETSIVATDVRSAVNALQFGQADAIWHRADDDLYLRALRSHEGMQSRHDNPLVAAGHLLDALADADACPFYNRDAMMHAAGVASQVGKFTPANKTTVQARWAQSVARNNTLRHAMNTLGLCSTETTLAVPILAQQTDLLEVDELHALATLSKPSDRKAIRDSIRSKSQN